MDSPYAAVRALEALNTAATQIGVSFSAFHTTALVVAGVGAYGVVGIVVVFG